MILSKYLAHAGIVSRRKASELIKTGKVFVNNHVITKPEYVITEIDRVRIGKKIITLQQKKYIVLNKPAGVITTCHDEQGRSTVMDLLRKKEFVYPVGRLDKNTTGILLLTNDGELAYQLTHPKFAIKKVYEVTLDKPFELNDSTHLKNGIRLSDGFFKADMVVRLKNKRKNVVRVTIHSGKKHIIRRIFAKISYTVIALDRINFAGLTKKGLLRGMWRNLTHYEITALHKT